MEIAGFTIDGNVILAVLALVGVYFAWTMGFFKGLFSKGSSLETFADFNGDSSSNGSVLASEGSVSDNTVNKNVADMGNSASSCYPQPNLTAQDLLPKEDSKAIQDFNVAKPVGEGILKGVNMLDAGFHIGVNTVGQSLRNANQQLRCN